MGVPVTGQITAYAGGTYATIDAILGLPPVVADAAGLNAITALRRRQGMVVVVQADIGDGALMAYQLTAASPWAFTSADWTLYTPGGGGGSGTVTTVSVVTANGVSGSVATATTTPAITLVLGAITPTSIGSATTVTTQSPGDNTTKIASTAFVTAAVAAAGGGTVTTLSVVSAHGFAGTVATATTTPAITLSTTITGILKGDGTSISAASAPGDYLTSPVAIANGGTGQTAKQAAFDALSPVTTLGDMIYRDASNNVRLAGNMSTNKLFLNQTGAGASSAAPVWGGVAGTDLTGTVLASAIVTSSLTAVGTIVTGVWNGTAVGTAYLGATVRPFTAILGQGTPVATGTNSAGNYLICSKGGSFIRWDLAAVTAPVGASLVVDVMKSGDNGSTWTSLWASNPTNRPTLATTVTHNGNTSFDTTTFSAGDWLRFDIITVGSTTAGQNITLVIDANMSQ